MKLVISLLLSAGVLMSQSANAATVYWTDWTQSTSNSVTGVINAPGISVGINTSSSVGYYFVQTDDASTNYYLPSTPYTSSAIDNPPVSPDIISLNTGGTETIVFSTAVVDPLIALVSWNGNTLEFNAPIEVLSYDVGYWGYGTPIINSTGTGLYGDGDLHAVVRLKGTYNSISFTHTSELWHGYTVGITAAVPEPETYGLMLAGLGLLGVAARRRAKQQA